MPASTLNTPGSDVHLDEAARLLEQAIRAGCHDAQAHYLLAMCYKRLGRFGDARQALGKISQPDGNVWLQLGLLALAGNDLAQAETEFRQAWQVDPSCYLAAYNLLLTLLCQGRLADCVTLLTQFQPLAPSAEDQRFLSLLAGLLESTLEANAQGNGGAGPGFPLSQVQWADVTEAEEERLVQLLAGLRQFEVAYPLLQQLASLHSGSSRAQEAHLEIVLMQAKHLVGRGCWQEAFDLLLPLGRAIAQEKTAGKPVQIALLNLLGCCACLLQDFGQGVWYFSAALARGGPEARLHQNLALAHEWQGRLDQAEVHWNRFFDLLKPETNLPPLPNYLAAVTCEGLCRLADLYSRKERAGSAVSFLQRAQRLRPQDVDILDRLYHLYVVIKRPDEAKRTLRKLRELRPRDPQFELYELETRQLRTMGDIDRLLGDLRRTLQRHPGDMRVEEKTVSHIGITLPLLRRYSDQLSDQLGRVQTQLRRLPSSQINWRTTREVMRDLREDFAQLRRLVNKCLQLVVNEEQRRFLHQMADYLDRQIEACHTMAS